MDTAVRLAMQSMEIGTESSVRDYLKRFRNTVRFHFSWRALTLCPDKKSVAAQLALCAGVPAFGALAVVYRLIKSMRKNGRG